MLENFIVLIIIMFVNIVLIYRPLPIFAFPIEIFTLYLYVTEFLTLSSSVIPLNPFFTIFLILINISGLVINALELKSK